MDFSKFDATINKDEMGKAIAEAQANGSDFEAPAGKYIAKIEKMELKTTKTDGRPMFSAQLRITDAGEDAKEDVLDYLSHFKNKKPCLFLNRVIYGTKNDANMISSVIGWLNKLETSVNVEFKNYSQFADVILDVYEEVVDSIEVAIDYDPNAFNSVVITEIFDL